MAFGSMRARCIRQAGVEAASVDILQDEHVADINLILQALWLANEGVLSGHPAYIPNDYGRWVKEQVMPIRTMRRGLKTDWVGAARRGL